jgi:hypothetical protein
VNKVNELPNGDLVVSYGWDIANIQGLEEY